MRDNAKLIGFKEKGDNRYSVQKQQLFFAIIGIAAICVAVISAFPVFYNAPLPGIIVGGIVYAVIIAGGCFFTALGLFRIETEIDLNTRKASIIRKNYRGQKSTREFSLDDIGISAIRMGATSSTASGVSTRERWIVKAGFGSDDYDTAIYSQETASEEERNEVMLELCRFFFPKAKQISEEQIRADENSAVLVL